MANTRRVAQQVMEQLDRRNLGGVAEHFASDARFHGWAPQALDKEGYQRFMAALLAAFPDSRFPVEDWVVEGDKAVARHRFEGTHRQEFQGVAATGKRVSISGIVLLHVRDGRIAEGWLNADMLSLLQQLGAVPAPTQTA